MSENLPRDLYFIPIFLRREAIDIIRRNNLHYDDNTQKGNLGCWLGDIASLNSEDLKEIKEFILYPDEMSDDFKRAQLLGEI